MQEVLNNPLGLLTWSLAAPAGAPVKTTKASLCLNSKQNLQKCLCIRIVDPGWNGLAAVHQDSEIWLVRSS